MSKKTVKNCWGLEKGSLVERHLGASTKGQRKAEAIVQTAKKAKSVIRVFDSDESIRIVVTPTANEDQETDAALKTPLKCRVRDAMGALIANAEKLEADELTVNLDLPADLVEAAVVGIEIALYRFRRVVKGEPPKYKLILKSKGKTLQVKTLAPGLALGQAINVARHLTNLPPNWLNPTTYAAFARDFLSGTKGVKVEVWDAKKLASENMNLHLCVGLGSNEPPCLVRIKYSGGGKKPHIALVGKGITFDSGGLDIKPAAGMRLMKKDMGGSAAVLGAIYWAAITKTKCNIDGYLALAENSISSHAFRPSDVITGRNGLAVEIHNTDAEGRLVLADSLTLAAEQKPRAVVDVATLTGAIKVALGGNIAGLFSNDKKLSDALNKAGQSSGDLNWPMPLYQTYRSSFASNFADMINSPDGFAGAITAALFLEKFVDKTAWAHLDIYAWKDSAEGAWLESGGSGQGVLNLSEWLQR